MELVKSTGDDVSVCCVGDGANDTQMLGKADIGIAIEGEADKQALQASDYAIANLSMLWKLFFVHGKLSYQRISEMVFYFFYKDIIFTFP